MTIMVPPFAKNVYIEPSYNFVNFVTGSAKQTAAGMNLSYNCTKRCLVNTVEQKYGRGNLVRIIIITAI